MLRKGIKYHLLKVLPYGKEVKINLGNGLKYILRSKTMDKSILKEIWITNLYDKHGIRVEKGDTVIDIGAHVGIFSTYASQRVGEGRVFAFEPHPDNFKMLSRHKEINGLSNLSVNNLAITGESGNKNLNVSPDNNTGGHSLYLKADSSKKIEVETMSLREFCEQEKIEKINFLKLDCEGAEFEILKSDQAILDRVEKVILECHPYEGNPASDMMEILEKNNFQLYRDSDIDLNKAHMIYGVKKGLVNT